MRWVLGKIYSLLLSVVIISSTFQPIVYAENECTWFWCTNYTENVKVPGTTEWNTGSALLDTIRSTINWILWILATVALVICLYSWFKMLTSWWDSKWYDSWLKTLKNAALWLAIIWLSRLIVSAIFWFVNLQAGWESVLVDWQ